MLPEKPLGSECTWKLDEAAGGCAHVCAHPRQGRWVQRAGEERSTSR